MFVCVCVSVWMGECRSFCFVLWGLRIFVRVVCCSLLLFLPLLLLLLLSLISGLFVYLSVRFVLFRPIKKRSFNLLCVFESFFRTLAVNYVSDFFFFFLSVRLFVSGLFLHRLF